MPLGLTNLDARKVSTRSQATADPTVLPPIHTMFMWSLDTLPGREAAVDQTGARPKLCWHKPTRPRRFQRSRRRVLPSRRLLPEPAE